VAGEAYSQMSRALRIATRDSELALRRARRVQAMLAATGVGSELVPLRAAGDRKHDDSVDRASARTAFTRELESALTRNRADIAIHAYPDLATDVTPGLVLVAVTARDDPRDALVLNRLLEGASLDALPRGTRIGAPGVRCRAQLRALYPDLDVVQLRGDLPTRLRKVEEGQVLGTIVSASALKLLDISQGIAAYLEPPGWLPAPAQGAIVIQAREDDAETRDIARALDDGQARRDTAAERAVLAALEGGLQSPVSALVVNTAAPELHGSIADDHGRALLRARLPLDDAAPELVGVRVANDLRAKGASRILDALRRATRVSAPQPDL
jgi:hydroxymethylbilane synthase